MKLLLIVSISMVIFAIGAAGCTSPYSSISARVTSEPFIGTWQSPTNQVRFHVFENHSVFVTAENPCNISELPFRGHTGYECTSYVFTDGNWTYGPNQTYNVTLWGNITLYGKPLGSFFSSNQNLKAKQIIFLYFSYDNATDTIYDDNMDAPLQRVSSKY
jgi:hypothetical protein